MLHVVVVVPVPADSYRYTVLVQADSYRYTVLDLVPVRYGTRVPVPVIHILYLRSTRELRGAEADRLNVVIE
jgi:hypothetical protein